MTIKESLTLPTFGYKEFLVSLSWDEFRTYESKVNKNDMTQSQCVTLKEESGRRAEQFNNYMSF